LAAGDAGLLAEEGPDLLRRIARQVELNGPLALDVPVDDKLVLAEERRGEPKLDRSARWRDDVAGLIEARGLEAVGPLGRRLADLGEVESQEEGAVHDGQRAVE